MTFLIIKYTYWSKIAGATINDSWKEIRHHCLDLDKQSYSHFSYPRSSPTTFLSLHDLFTLDFSGIWHLHKLQYVSTYVVQKVGIASVFCVSLLLIPGHNEALGILVVGSLGSLSHFSPLGTLADGAISIFPKSVFAPKSFVSTILVPYCLQWFGTSNCTVAIQLISPRKIDKPVGGRGKSGHLLENHDHQCWRKMRAYSNQCMLPPGNLLKSFQNSWHSISITHLLRLHGTSSITPNRSTLHNILYQEIPSTVSLYSCYFNVSTFLLHSKPTFFPSVVHFIYSMNVDSMLTRNQQTGGF
jgi:hypothetical protein